MISDEKKGARESKNARQHYFGHLADERVAPHL